LADENKLMMDAFAGVYLITADVDAWNHDKVTALGFKFDGIPIFFKLDAQGKPTGKKIDGDAWGSNSPYTMAPVLKKFFHSN
jgi:hypothetical protein